MAKKINNLSRTTFYLIFTSISFLLAMVINVINAIAQEQARTSNNAEIISTEAVASYYGVDAINPNKNPSLDDGVWQYPADQKPFYQNTKDANQSAETLYGVAYDPQNANDNSSNNSTRQ